MECGVAEPPGVLPASASDAEQAFALCHSFAYVVAADEVEVQRAYHRQMGGSAEDPPASSFGDDGRDVDMKTVLMRPAAELVDVICPKA
jgi:hypothetical protein